MSKATNESERDRVRREANQRVMARAREIGREADELHARNQRIQEKMVRSIWYRLFGHFRLP
jgi:hypothetical protein